MVTATAEAVGKTEEAASIDVETGTAVLVLFEFWMVNTGEALPESLTKPITEEEKKRMEGEIVRCARTW